MTRQMQAKPKLYRNRMSCHVAHPKQHLFSQCFVYCSLLVARSVALLLHHASTSLPIQNNVNLCGLAFIDALSNSGAQVSTKRKHTKAENVHQIILHELMGCGGGSSALKNHLSIFNDCTANTEYSQRF